MVVKTLFRNQHRYEPGEVEVNLLPGIPQIHVVGLPDAGIRESGVRLKSALRSCGLRWPEGQQIVVNLRPAHLRKEGSGVDLAIAMAFLAISRQLPPAVKAVLDSVVVYGEVSLDGSIHAPQDLGPALRFIGDAQVLTGKGRTGVRQGRWLEWPSLASREMNAHEEKFDWSRFWRPPALPDLHVHPEAAQALWIAAHMGLSVLIAGPQGSGKTTWARALYALTPEPEVEKMEELVSLFGEGALENRWRPLEQPHHSTTPQAMVGGGYPLQFGVISRAHGGMLVMDEFLEFHPTVLEALREPLENGSVEIARKGCRQRVPARFQLVGTTNLCPCGQLYPGRLAGCNRNIGHCRAVCRRLSGPVLDRFDMLAFSHTWLSMEPKVGLSEVKEILRRMAEFAKSRGTVQDLLPLEYEELQLSHRRRRSLLRVARACADFEESVELRSEHFHQASKWSTLAMTSLAQLFA
jgi:magnesium chelatase family protein